jgi:hypothetical protein
MAYLDNASRFGRNMPSTGIATAQLAGQQGGQAVGQVGNLQSITAAPAASISPLLGGALNSNVMAGNLANTNWNEAFQGVKENNNQTVGAWNLAAKIGGTVAGAMMASSRKVKHVGKKVRGRSLADAVEKSPSHDWSYKPGQGDGSTQPRMGPTAEALHAVAPTVSDGSTVDIPSMLGMHHGAIGNLNQRLRKVEKGA